MKIPQKQLKKLSNFRHDNPNDKTVTPSVAKSLLFIKTNHIKLTMIFRLQYTSQPWSFYCCNIKVPFVAFIFL